MGKSAGRNSEDDIRIVNRIQESESRIQKIREAHAKARRRNVFFHRVQREI
jgi:hypothetical protein